MNNKIYFLFFFSNFAPHYKNAAIVACLFSKKVMFLLKTILIYDPVDHKALLSGRPRNGGLTVVHNAGAALIDYFVDWYLN